METILKVEIRNLKLCVSDLKNKLQNAEQRIHDVVGLNKFLNSQIRLLKSCIKTCNIGICREYFEMNTQYEADLDHHIQFDDIVDDVQKQVQEYEHEIQEIEDSIMVFLNHHDQNVLVTEYGRRNYIDDVEEFNQPNAVDNKCREGNGGGKVMDDGKNLLLNDNQ